MQKSKRLKITDVNPHLICVLCGGYYVDATTIIECLHSFCRSCLVKYLEKNKYCPICDVQIHKNYPLLNIRRDRTLQNIVYKLVPSLFKNEMQRRQFFYSKNKVTLPRDPEARGEVPETCPIILPEENISICLEYHNDSSSLHGSRRYFQCPALLTVGHLQKLIRGKFGLASTHHVNFFFKDEPLKEELTLMDLGYTYPYKRGTALHLFYRILELRKKRIKVVNQPKEVSHVTVQEKEEAERECEWKEVQLEISENGVMSARKIDSDEGTSVALPLPPPLLSTVRPLDKRPLTPKDSTMTTPPSVDTSHPPQTPEEPPSLSTPSQLSTSLSSPALPPPSLSSPSLPSTTVSSPALPSTPLPSPTPLPTSSHPPPPTTPTSQTPPLTSISSLGSSRCSPLPSSPASSQRPSSAPCLPNSPTTTIPTTSLSPVPKTSSLLSASSSNVYLLQRKAEQPSITLTKVPAMPKMKPASSDPSLKTKPLQKGEVLDKIVKRLIPNSPAPISPKPPPQNPKPFRYKTLRTPTKPWNPTLDRNTALMLRAASQAPSAKEPRFFKGRQTPLRQDPPTMAHSPSVVPPDWPHYIPNHSTLYPPSSLMFFSSPVQRIPPSKSSLPPPPVTSSKPPMSPFISPPPAPYFPHFYPRSLPNNNYSNNNNNNALSKRSVLPAHVHPISSPPPPHLAPP